jgi:hypothetical protein
MSHRGPFLTKALQTVIRQERLGLPAISAGPVRLNLRRLKGAAAVDRSVKHFIKAEERYGRC